MVKLTLDIVVPTIRLDIRHLNNIAALRVPDDMTLHLFFVVDDPDGPGLSFGPFLDKKITVIRNPKTLGGGLSRNRAFESGKGEYVLFMDDDIDVPENLLESYLEAIKTHPEAPGFVGSTRFPPCINSFTSAAIASDILTFWDIAESRPSLAWGITANLIVRREAVGNIRFSPRFPKKGGGEDVDFCLRIVERSGKWFTSVPSAKVTHPWWGNGAHQYTRFARWAYGDSVLPVHHPAFKFRNAPNLIESVLLMLLLAALGFVLLRIPLTWFFTWLGAALVLEYLVDGIRMKLKGKKLSVSIAIQATSIRLANDIGRIAGHLRRFRLAE